RIPERHKSIGYYTCASGMGCSPCEFFHRARSCKHGQQCAFCHLHKPRCSRNAVQRRRLKKHMLGRGLSDDGTPLSDDGTLPSEGGAESRTQSPSRATEDELQTPTPSGGPARDAELEEARGAALPLLPPR
ncbi:unnamed protein product, partial [Prorocentrum cordatum]